MTPYDVVPSIFQFLFLPMCEGIAVGLLAGSAILFALARLEHFFAPSDHPVPVADPRVIKSCQPAQTRRGARVLPTARMPLAKAC